MWCFFAFAHNGKLYESLAGEGNNIMCIQDASGDIQWNERILRCISLKMHLEDIYYWHYVCFFFVKYSSSDVPFRELTVSHVCKVMYYAFFFQSAIQTWTTIYCPGAVSVYVV